MTKKLKWRLSKLPTVDELQSLVNSKVISNAEAKEILFSETDEEEREIDSYKQEIKFLKKLVDKLSDRPTIVESIKYVEKPYFRYDWYKPYTTWSTTDDSLTYVNGNSDITLTGGVTSTVTEAFSSIQT